MYIIHLFILRCKINVNGTDMQIYLGISDNKKIAGPHTISMSTPQLSYHALWDFYGMFYFFFTPLYIIYPSARVTTAMIT